SHPNCTHRLCPGSECIWRNSMARKTDFATFIGLFLSTLMAQVTYASAASVPLTFEQRVSYQRAIEEVYWQHRIWPKENKVAKPSLDKVMPESVIRAKVEDYLKKSNAITEIWQRPITAEQLQAEMDRMTKNTKEPEVLRELFAALDNNPQIIAECLARPSIADRLIHKRYASLKPFHSQTKRNFEKWWWDEKFRLTSNIVEPSFSYHLKSSLTSANCTDDPWTSMQAPAQARSDHTAVWTGSEMIVWG